MKTLDEKIKLEKPLLIEAKKICIGGDTHIPFQDNDLMREMINTCQDRKIRSIIVNGDFIDCKSISDFIDVQQTELTFQDEMEEAEKVLNLLCKNFDNVYFINSNHENRFARKMEGNADIRDLFKMFDGSLKQGEDYVVSIYDHCILNNSWYICHPNIYSTVPLSLPRILSSKYQMNVICGHLHRLAIGKDISNKFYCIESGGLFDSNKLEYLCKTTKNPVQTSGYVIIEDGKA
jgi:hypothetical protein